MDGYSRTLLSTEIPLHTTVLTVEGREVIHVHNSVNRSKFAKALKGMKIEPATLSVQDVQAKKEIIYPVFHFLDLARGVDFFDSLQNAVDAQRVAE